MLPSMPLIATPLKESSDNIQRETTTDSKTDLVSLDKCPSNEFQFVSVNCKYEGDPDAAELIKIEESYTNPCPKKSFPLKHVTPILKKYHRKGNKLPGPVKGNNTDGVEKQSLRPIAPKPIMVVISSPGTTISSISQIPPNEGDSMPDISCNSEPAHNVPDGELSSEIAENQQKSSEDKKSEPQFEEPKKSSQVVEENKDVEPSGKKDNEDELAALMLASTTIRSSPKSRSATSVKKKSKHIRDIEATLNLLAPDSDDVKVDKAFGFAQAYFLKVTERLDGKDDVLYQEFLKTMNDFGHTIFSVTDLYWKVTSMLNKYPDLAEEFLAFLLPEQAMRCGKFMEHLMLTKMREFFRKLEVYFTKQPQQMHKIYSGLSTLSSQTNVTVQDVRSTILPLLKGNSLLVESFLQLLPQERPQDSCMTEFEDMNCGDADNYHSDEDWFETVEVPDQKDMYGGDRCMCVCHETKDDKYRRRALHCVSCGTKFIYGRVFVQTGKVLRPAKVVFDDDKVKTIKRLSAMERPKGRVRKKAAASTEGTSGSKDNTPTKSGNCDDPRHDAEEETVNKTSPPKSSRVYKARTPSSSHKKTTSKASAAKSIHSEGKETGSSSKNDSKSTTKEPKTSTSHAVRAANLSTIKTRAESSQHSSKKSKMDIGAKQNSVCPLKVPTFVPSSITVSQPTSNQEHYTLPMPTEEKEIPPQTESEERTSPISFKSHIPVPSTCGLLVENELPTSVVPVNEEKTELTTSTLSVLHDESATLPPVPTSVEVTLQDFSSLSQVLKSSALEPAGEESCATPVVEMDTSDPQPENVTLEEAVTENTTALVCSEETKCGEQICRMDVSGNVDTQAPENVVLSANNSDGQIEMEVDSVDTSAENIDHCMETKEGDTLINVDNEEIDNKICDAETVHDRSSTLSWTREEDKIILQMFQLGCGTEQTLHKISEQLSQRTVDEIRDRFHTLMNLLQQMTGVKMEQDTSNSVD